MLKYLLPATIVLIAVGVANADITTGLIAYYDFESVDPNNSGDGTTIPDASGSSNPLDLTIENAGSNNAVVAVPDSLGSLNFGNVFHGRGSGPGSPIARRLGLFDPDGDDIRPRNATMAAWFKLRPEDTGNINTLLRQTFFSDSEGRMGIYVTPPANLDPNEGPIDDTVKGGAFVFSQSSGNSWSPQPTDESSRIRFADNQWHHIAATYKNDTNEFRLFIDGQIKAQVFRPELIWSNRGDLVINDQENETGFGGYLDNVAFYDRTLSQNDVLGFICPRVLAGICPEPSAIMIAVVCLGGLACKRFRRTTA